MNSRDLMTTLSRQTKRATAIIAAAGLVAFGLVFVAGSQSAQAVTPPLPSPANILQRDGNVVTADPLPTIQIDNGYVWAQTMIGNVVYAAGSFSNARQAGTAAGAGTLTSRTNILAYNITTGALTSFAPTVNGVIKGIAASPDGTRIYIGGSFNTVDGQTRYNLAAVDSTTGALVPGFSPSIGGTGIYAMVATASTLYVGGLFTQGNATARKNLAAFSTSNGALLGWAPTTDLQVDAMVMDPSQAKLIIGGRFGGVNGVTQRGLAALDLNDGSILPWAAPATVINGASSGQYAGKAGIFGLTADASGVYGTGWVYADVATGNLEGAFAAEAGTGNIRWIADCHGDEYGVYSTGSVVYTTSHTHQCDTVGLAPEQPIRTYRYIQAFTAAPGGILTRSPSVSNIYKDWSGTVSPAPYAWYPDFTVGNTSGLGQAGLSITGDTQYISVGGEFGSVNNKQFAGLVRFAINPTGGAKQGPRLSGDTWTGGSATSKSAGTVRVTMPTNWDRDDLHETYKLYRTGTTAPVATTVADSTWWNTPSVTLKDTGLTPGSSQTYRVTATDADGNTATSNLLPVTVASGTPSIYGDRVLDDNASIYWRLGSDPTDWAGGPNPVIGSGVTSITPGAVVTDTGDTASAFDGTSNGLVSTTTTRAAGSALSVEAWIKTTTTTGGKIVGYGNSQSGNSTNYDRHLYMTNDGRVTFGVYDGNTRTLQSPSALNDGSWHQVVGTLSPTDGLKLYVDGALVGSDSTATAGQAFSGYWRVGGDNLNGWPNQPSSQNFTGQIDEVSIYSTALALGSISQQYDDAQGISSPTAAFTATPTGLTVAVDGTASAAPQGRTITGYSWNWGDGTSAGSGSTASHDYAVAGLYQQTLTVTDSSGRTGTLTQAVAVLAPNVPPTASFTSTSVGLTLAADASASTDSDGTVASYSWNWGDGTAAGSGKTATHSYAAPGTYSVTLTVTDNQGGTGTSNSSVFVTHSAPVASFTNSVSALAVSVNASASTASDGATLAYSWNWGDGTAAGSGKTATHSYATPGNYTVVLTLTDSLAGTATTSAAITTTHASPVASFTSSVSGLAIGVDASASTAADGATLSYSWNWGDGSAASGGKTATHSYATPGTYTVVLTLTDSLAATATKSAAVTATHAAPVASFTNSVSGLGVSVDASASTASDGATLSYSWNWGDGTAAGTGKTATHNYSTGGSFTIVLTVTDTLGATATKSTVVNPVAPVHTPPVASFTNSVSGLGLSVDASASTASDGATMSYSWNWGDGTAVGTGKTATHSYATGGNYTVVLTVTDSLGATATISASVSPVGPTHAAPVPSFTNTVSGLGVSVDASASTASDGATLSYSWNWGDGTAASTGKTATHSYGVSGSYTIVLTVTDSLAASASKSTSVSASNAPAAVAKDDFGRSVTGGWGSADTGGAYSVMYGSASSTSVSGGVGVVALAPSDTRNLMLTGAQAQDTTTSVVFSLDAAPSTGGAYAGVVARQMANTNDNYTTRVWLNSNGSVWLVIQHGGTVLRALQLPGITRAAGDSFNLQVSVTGTSPTTIAAKLWRVGTAEPASAQLTVTDSSAALQGSGYVGLHAARAGSATTTGTVTFDSYSVTKSN
jgi:PKD repeat protein